MQSQPHSHSRFHLRVHSRVDSKQLRGLISNQCPRISVFSPRKFQTRDDLRTDDISVTATKQHPKLNQNRFGIPRPAHSALLASSHQNQKQENVFSIRESLRRRDKWRPRRSTQVELTNGSNLFQQQRQSVEICVACASKRSTCGSLLDNCVDRCTSHSRRTRNQRTQQNKSHLTAGVLRLRNQLTPIQRHSIHSS